MIPLGRFRKSLSRPVDGFYVGDLSIQRRISTAALLDLALAAASDGTSFCLY